MSISAQKTNEVMKTHTIFSIFFTTHLINGYLWNELSSLARIAIPLGISAIFRADGTGSSGHLLVV